MFISTFNLYYSLIIHILTLYSRDFLDLVQKPHSEVNPCLNKPEFAFACSTNLLKTLWAKKKLLSTSNFLLFPLVFSILMANFTPKKLLTTCNFPFPSVFYPFGDISLNLEESKTKIVVMGRVNSLPNNKIKD